jgi:hypothetical protein
MDHTSITEASELLTRFISPVIAGEAGGYLFPCSFSFARSCGQTNSAGSRKDGDIWRNRRTHWRRVAEPRPEESELIPSGEFHWFDSTEKLGEVIWARLGRTRTGGLENWSLWGVWEVQQRRRKPKCDRKQSRILPVATLRMRGCQVRAGPGTGNITINYTYYHPLQDTAVVLLHDPQRLRPTTTLPHTSSATAAALVSPAGLPHRHADVTSTENNPQVTSLCSLGLYLLLTTTFFPFDSPGA